MLQIENDRNWKPRVGDGASSTRATPEGIPPLIWQVLAARGFSSAAEIHRWLSPSLKDLRDPFSIIDMEVAVQRLLVAHRNQEKICIYCDYDLDGTSACAMLFEAFGHLGFQNISHYQPKRLTEGYGLHKDAIARIAERGVTLILTADLGITAVDEVAFARSLGIDVIVTDHHLPKEILPAAVAVVNPNRTECRANLGHLCGTGVAFYLILALRRSLLEQGLELSGFDPKSLLDCFAIATLTDMVPLVEENRVLVKHGLLQLAKTARPGLKALLQALNLWGIPLTSADVAIRFAPKLNALSRMEKGIQPLDIYLASDERTAENLVTEVLSNNQLRQASQREAETEALQQMHERPPKSCCFVWSKNFHRGVVGLVATRLTNEFLLPAYVGSVDDRGRVVGSARMPEGIALNLLDALEANSELLVQFGGHAVACGFELEAARAPELAERLDAWFAQKLNETRVSSEWVYDAEATLDELNAGFMRWYEQMSPFGVQFDTPLFVLRNVPVASVQTLKGGHLRLTLGDRSGSSKNAVWFSPPKDHLMREQALRPNICVDVLAEPQWNYFAGRRTLQLLIQDLRRSSS